MPVRTISTRNDTKKCSGRTVNPETNTHQVYIQSSTEEVEFYWIYDRLSNWVSKGTQFEHESQKNEQLNEVSNERGETTWIETKRDESKLTLNENWTIETKWIETKGEEMNRDETRRNGSRLNEKNLVETKRDESRSIQSSISPPSPTLKSIFIIFQTNIHTILACQDYFSTLISFKSHAFEIPFLPLPHLFLSC